MWSMPVSQSSSEKGQADAGVAFVVHVQLGAVRVIHVQAAWKYARHPCRRALRNSGIPHDAYNIRLQSGDARFSNASLPPRTDVPTKVSVKNRRRGASFLWAATISTTNQVRGVAHVQPPPMMRVTALPSNRRFRIVSSNCHLSRRERCGPMAPAVQSYARSGDKYLADTVVLRFDSLQLQADADSPSSLAALTFH